MNKKNVIFLVVDSLNYSRVKSSNYAVMPYLKKLEQESIYCQNMYSEAPYTEAACMNIYCGQDTLNHNGYISRYKHSPKTLFEAMQDAGYQTYSFCSPSSSIRGVDGLYYHLGFEFGYLWAYRFSHFANVLKNNNLTENDYAVLIELFDDNFSNWIRFTCDIESNKEICSMIVGNDKNNKPELVRKDVESEYATYQNDKKAYINSVLEQGTSHKLFSIPAYVQNNKIKNREFIEQIRQLYTPLFKKIKRKNIKLNRRNNKGVFKGANKKLGFFLRHPSKVNLKNYLKALYISINTIRDLDLFTRIERPDEFKNAPSLNKHLEHFYNWAENRQSDKPYFACIHVDDVHNPEIFFTYDTEDIELLKRQKEISEKYVDSLPKDYKGVISHDLSLLYIDSEIKRMVDFLKEKGLYEDTTIVITADHGFSFAGYPIRDSFVINKYLENYNIPFVIVNSGLAPNKIEEICRSTDIATTLVELSGGVVPENFSGHSILDKPIRDRKAIIEFCGGGCPDLSRREIMAAAFDKEWFVGVNYTLDSEISLDSVSEIYNLAKDPLQLKNLVKGEYDKDRISMLLEVIKARKEEIVKTR